MNTRITPRTHRGHGGDYVQEAARNDAIFHVKTTPKGARLRLLSDVYLYLDDDRPGGVRVILGDEALALSVLDLQAAFALAVQRAVEALQEGAS